MGLEEGVVYSWDELGLAFGFRPDYLGAAGGICISSTIHEQVEGKLPATARDMGEREVKNIPRPIRVFSLAAG